MKYGSSKKSGGKKSTSKPKPKASGGGKAHRQDIHGEIHCRHDPVGTMAVSKGITGEMKRGG